MMLYDLSQKLGKLLQQRGLMLATAESCTGGYIAQMITAVADSSQWFERGFVTYSNEAKMEMLSVSAHTLAVHGAVSSAVVAEMAVGALKHSHAQVSIAVSGIAGPSGGSRDKPVGTVYFAIAGGDEEVKTYTHSISSCDEACAQSSSGVYIPVHEQRDKHTTKSQLERRRVYKQYFSGDRDAIRKACVEFALRQLYVTLCD